MYKCSMWWFGLVRADPAAVYLIATFVPLRSCLHAYELVGDQGHRRTEGIYPRSTVSVYTACILHGVCY